MFYLAILYILIIIVSAIALFWIFSTLTFNHWKQLGVFYPKPIPFIGNMGLLLLMKQSVHEMYDQLYRLIDKLPYGGFFEMRSPVLILKDPEIIRRVLITDFKYFIDRGYSFTYVNKQLNPLNEHLFHYTGQRWKVLRQKMSPVFTSGKLKGMQNQISDCVSMFIDNVEMGMTDDGKDIDLKDVFPQLTVDVTGSCAFGIECNAIKLKNDFRMFAHEVMKPRVSLLVKYFLQVIDKRLPHLFQLTDFPSYYIKFFQNAVYDAVLYRRQNNMQRSDLLQQLMDMQNAAADPKFSKDVGEKSLSKDNSFDEVDIAANSFVFFIGGYETTSLTLSYCLYELALNQEIQEKLLAEILQAYNKNGGKIDFNSFHDMPYLDAVISETLRKYPPFPALYRQCIEDYVIPETGLKLKRGDRIHIPVWSLHHDWRYYPNPELFDPERFNDENKQSRPNGTFLPFGDGPRYCIGKRFAEMVMKLVLSKMLMLYHFTPCSKTETPLVYEKSLLTVSPQNGVWVNISKRVTSSSMS